MSIMTQLSLTALRFVVSGACKATGLPTSGEQAVDFLIERFTDQSQRLPKAINAATHRAWKTLELALAGDTLWGKLTTRAEDQALAQELRTALVVVKYDESIGDKRQFFQACLKELRAVRRSPVPPDELHRHTRAMATYADPAALVEAEWHAAGAMADECERSGHTHLAAFLRLRAGELPFLTVAVRYYFRRAVEEDRELFQGLAFAKLEAVSTAQERQFATLAETLDRHAARLEGMLAGVLEDVGYIRENMVTKDDVARLIESQQEMMRMFNLRGREVRPSDASRIQQTADIQRVREISHRVRNLPESARRQNPEVVRNGAILDYAAGNHAMAVEGFQEVAELASGNPSTQAEAHYNAYRAALEKHATRKVKSEGDYQLALRELMEAARLAPERYTPFDLHEYEPRRILGHGGFGVTIQCREVNADRDVAIKILLADDLERKIEEVLAEGRILAKLPHKNIVELKAVRFADPARKARPYFVMEYLDGYTTLADHVQKHGPLEPRDVAKIAPQIAEGLKAAHDKGIFHRDVKPANVMIRFDGEGDDFEDRRWSVKLIDFGLAVRRDLANPSYSTSSNAHANSSIGAEVAGTINYAAPEQLDVEFQQTLAAKPKEEQHAIRVRSDIYSFGKTCIYALCGDTDFDHDEAERQHTWRRILGRCTKKRPPDQRPKDFTEVLGMLQTDGLYAPPLPQEAVEENGELNLSLEPLRDNDPPLLLSEEQVKFDWNPYKIAGASLLPGLGHIILGQRAKGFVLLLLSLLLVVPIFWSIYPTMIAVWVIMVAIDAFGSALTLKREGEIHPWSIFDLPPQKLERRHLVIIGILLLVVWLPTHFVFRWLSGTSGSSDNFITAQADPRFVGEWTKPNDAGGLERWHGKINYVLTVTPNTINWSYVETKGLGPDTVNKSSRCRWVKANEIQLLDVEGQSETGKGKKTPVLRLDFVNDDQVLITADGIMWMDPFAECHGKFSTKKAGEKQRVNP